MMKKVYLFLAIAVLLGAILYSCTQPSTSNETIGATKDSISMRKTQDTCTTTVEGNYKDPNQASELALLMRSMYTDSEKIKQAVVEGKFPEDFREKFKKIHSAVATEAEMKDAAFAAMANVFLKNMDKLYDNQNQIDDYNILIQSCLACHQNHCPGPMSRIKKLVIK